MDTQIRNYSFSAVGKTVTFTDFSVLALDSIRLIVNVTDGIVIYGFAMQNKGGSVTGNVLHLEYDTSTMSDSDALQIIYNTEELPASQSGQEEMLSVLHLLKRMVNLLESNGVVDIQGKQRVTVDNTIYTLPASYGIAAYKGNTPTGDAPAFNGANTVYYQPTWSGPIDPRWEHFDNAQIAYNTGIRSKLSITP